LKASNYTSAGMFPVKLMQSREAIVEKRIIPIHIQIQPTNRCNANCPWCSVSKIDRTIEMPVEEMKNMLNYFAAMGTKSATITGGGEPTIHPHISEIIRHANKVGIECGLVTNGLLWGKEPNDLVKELSPLLTWCRYSMVNKDLKNLIIFCENLPDTDVGVSFVVTDTTDVRQARALCEIADDISNLTHIRFVQELLSLPKEGLRRVEQACKDVTDKAIFQWRDEYVRGAKRCLISKLKPLIDASGNVYPCCGVQYAKKEITRRLPEEFKLGHWSEFHNMGVFDGSVCDCCYYNQYNELLEKLTEPMEHEKFV